MSDIIKACIDQTLSLNLLEQAKQIATPLHPANNPGPLELAADWHYLWKPGQEILVRF